MADHKCPAPGCEKQIPSHMLACREHWASVPKDIRQRVWLEARKNVYSEAHFRAIEDAIESMR